MIAGVVILFNGFLLFTYVAHFPAAWAVGRAFLLPLQHRRSRSWSCLALRWHCGPGSRHWFAANARLAARYWPGGRGADPRCYPLAGAPLLRFDRDTPQPELRELGHRGRAHLQPGDRLALLLPGDTEDSVGSLLRGVLLFTPPRRPGLDIHIETSVSPATLASAAAAG